MTRSGLVDSNVKETATQNAARMRVVGERGGGGRKGRQRRRCTVYLTKVAMTQWLITQLPVAL